MAPAFVREHKDVALVTVVDSSGSTPRHAGTHMLVSAGGVLCGGIGGGRVELQVVELARRVAPGAAPASLRLNLVQDVAMCCVGSMEFFGPLASQVDFQVILCDDSETEAVDGNVLWADQVSASFDLRDIERQIGPVPGTRC